MNTAAPENPNALEISTSVGTALHDTVDALRALFALARIAFLILLALRIVRALVMPLTGLIAGAVLLSSHAVEAFLITPYAIAVHRFIILGEKTMSYRIAPSEPRFRRFFGWSLALSMLSAPLYISEILPPSWSKNFLVAVLLIPDLVIEVRAIVLFPAVAVDAPGANWRQAMADTAGHAWRIFFIMVGAMLTLIIMIVTPLLVLVSIMGDAVKEPVIMLFVTIAALLVDTLVVVIASRLYQWIGVRVKERG